ncbi:MAG: cytochrome C oxidase assembly protein [Pseudomonadota bacterium]
MGVGLTLTAFVVVIFGLTVAKMSNGIVVEGFDHTVRPSLLEVDPQ